MERKSSFGQAVQGRARRKRICSLFLGKAVVRRNRRHLRVIGVARTRAPNTLVCSMAPGFMYCATWIRFRFSSSSDSEVMPSASPHHRTGGEDAGQQSARHPSTIRDFLETDASEMRSLVTIIPFMAECCRASVTGVDAVVSLAINRRGRRDALAAVVGKEKCGYLHLLWFAKTGSCRSH
jgi:hypothetical protein